MFQKLQGPRKVPGKFQQGSSKISARFQPGSGRVPGRFQQGPRAQKLKPKRFSVGNKVPFYGNLCKACGPEKNRKNQGACCRGQKTRWGVQKNMVGGQKNRVGGQKNRVPLNVMCCCLMFMVV